VTATAAAWGARPPDGPLYEADRPSRPGRPHLATRASAVLVAAAGAFLLWPSTTAVRAGASTTTGLQSQAAAIAATVARDDALLQSVGQHYLAERSLLSAARAEEQMAERESRVVDHKVSLDQTALRSAAISAYVNAGSDGSLGLFLSDKPDQVADGQAYIRVAADQLDRTVTALTDAKHVLATELSTARQSATAAATALADATSARTSVLTTLSNERTLLASVQGQLAVLVAQQEAAQARAAEQAAQEAAKRSAANPVVAAAGQPAGPPAASGSATLTSASPIPTGTLTQDFAGIRNCESGGNYADDTGNGYYGAYQFSLGTWEGVGGSGLPSSAPAAVQDALAYRLYQRDGWGPWPACAAILGLG